MNLTEMWEYLTDHGIATDKELELVTNGWGLNKDTFETVLYARTGYNSFDQLED